MENPQSSARLTTDAVPLQEETEEPSKEQAGVERREWAPGLQTPTLLLAKA